MRVPSIRSHSRRTPRRPFRLAAAGAAIAALAGGAAGCGTGAASGPSSARHGGAAGMALGTGPQARLRSGAGTGDGVPVTRRLTLAAASALPADCIPRSGPPYQVSATGNFVGAFSLGAHISVNDIAGTFCALATVIPTVTGHPTATACFTFVLPVDGVDFAPLTATLNYLPGTTTTVGNLHAGLAQPVSGVVCNDAASGPLIVPTTVVATASATLFGATCAIGPVIVPVTAKVTGDIFDGNGRITIAAGQFAIPAVPASATCPSGLASTANEIVPLPAPPGVASFSVTGTVGVYLPNP